MNTNMNIAALLVSFVICVTTTPAFAQSLPTSFCGVTFGEVIPDDLIPDPGKSEMIAGWGQMDRDRTEYYFISKKGCPNEWNGFSIKNVIFYSVNDLSEQDNAIIDGVRFDLLAKDHRQAVKSLDRSFGINSKEELSYTSNRKKSGYSYTWKDEKMNLYALSPPNPNNVAKELMISLSRNDTPKINDDEDTFKENQKSNQPSDSTTDKFAIMDIDSLTCSALFGPLNS